MERVTDEEAGEGGWFWNEQVGSYRPPGALYCRECGVSVYINFLKRNHQSQKELSQANVSFFVFVYFN